MPRIANVTETVSLDVFLRVFGDGSTLLVEAGGWLCIDIGDIPGHLRDTSRTYQRQDCATAKPDAANQEAFDPTSMRRLDKHAQARLACAGPASMRRPG
eukprot:6180283-Pleurochrysis_carterae.AAC.1